MHMEIKAEEPGISYCPGATSQPPRKKEDGCTAAHQLFKRSFPDAGLRVLQPLEGRSVAGSPGSIQPTLFAQAPKA